MGIEHDDGEEDMATLEARQGRDPDQQEEERLDPTIAEIRLADLRRGKDADQMAAIYVLPKVIEHLGPLREDLSLPPDYTAADVRAYFRNNDRYAIVAINPEGRVIGTVALERVPRIPAARVQCWAVDTRVETEGPGVGLQLIKKVQALTFGPESEGGLELEHSEAGVTVGIRGEWTPRPVRILRAEGYRSPEMVPNRGISWDPTFNKGEGRWDRHRTVEQFRLPRAVYMQTTGQARILRDLAELRGEQPFTPFRPRTR